MLLLADELMALPEFSDMDAYQLQAQINALELGIRAYTNNHFQLRNARVRTAITGGELAYTSPHFLNGDTLEVSGSAVSDGLYIFRNGALDRPVNESNALVTVVRYPEDVKAGAVDILKWKVKNGDKIGVKSETLSRYSVSYEDSTTMAMGMPTALLGFLKPYRRARF